VLSRFCCYFQNVQCFHKCLKIYEFKFHLKRIYYLSARDPQKTLGLVEQIL
jgi:hypothetical protein